MAENTASCRSEKAQELDKNDFLHPKTSATPGANKLTSAALGANKLNL